MTAVKVRDRFDDPVTARVLEQAVTEGRKRQGTGVSAASVQYLAARKNGRKGGRPRKLANLR